MKYWRKRNKQSAYTYPEDPREKQLTRLALEGAITWAQYDRGLRRLDAEHKAKRDAAIAEFLDERTVIH